MYMMFLYLYMVLYTVLMYGWFDLVMEVLFVLVFLPFTTVLGSFKKWKKFASPDSKVVVKQHTSCNAASQFCLMNAVLFYVAYYHSKNLGSIFVIFVILYFFYYLFFCIFHLSIYYIQHFCLWQPCSLFLAVCTLLTFWYMTEVYYFLYLLYT